MKALVSFLAGILAAILGASAISFMSGNNVAIQVGGSGNKIHQSTTPQPLTPAQPQATPAATPQYVPQTQVPAPTQAPSATTQPPPSVSSAPLSPPVSPPVQTSAIPSRHVARHNNRTEDVQECSCPVYVVAEEETDEEDAPEEAEDCECEEPPTI